MRIHVIRHGLELLQQLLGLIDDGLVLQDGAVVRDIDGGGLRGVLVVDELGVVVPFAEGLEGGDGLWWSVGEVKGGYGGSEWCDKPFPRPREENTRAKSWDEIELT
jgi:hypothetical protein